MKKEKGLWTKNFTIITLGTIISSIGGIAMNFALSFAVLDHSGSTLLMGIFSAISLIPALILPIVISPYLDRFKRKPVIVGLDAVNGVLYLLFGMYIMKVGFQFEVYLLFSFITSAIGSIYQQAYNSYYPNLIPKGFAQKGYTVSSMIYPTISVLMTPVAGYLYIKFGMEWIVLLEGMLLLVASLFESRIDYVEEVHGSGKFDFHAYVQNLKDGLIYLKKEKGLRKIYTYMPITQGISEGMSTLIMAYFQMTPSLGIGLYSLFTVAEFIGRTIGGIVHYQIKIPPEKRFSLTCLVYYTYGIMNAILLWIAYPFMLLNRGICGFLGINSATLRESSVQNYIPDENRAKINALFNVAFYLMSMILRLFAGWMGEWMDIRYCVTLLGCMELLACYFIIYRNREVIKPVYNQDY